MNDDFIILPVLLNFDQQKQIGTLRLLKSALRPTPDFVFSLGYVTNKTDGSDYELHCVSMLSDGEYTAYLENNNDRIY